jgi:hypothetical protein
MDDGHAQHVPLFPYVKEQPQPNGHPAREQLSTIN